MLFSLENQFNESLILFLSTFIQCFDRLLQINTLEYNLGYTDLFTPTKKTFTIVQLHFNNFKKDTENFNE